MPESSVDAVLFSCSTNDSVYFAAQKRLREAANANEVETGMFELVFGCLPL